MTIDTKREENSPWEAIKVLFHTGKVTGKYSDCCNIKNSNNFKQLLDFSKTTLK